LARVILTSNLQNYYPEREFEMQGETVLEILNKMEKIRPHFLSYILDEHLHIRKHVNIFINSDLLQDKTNLKIKIDDDTEIHLMQALSGG